MKFLIHVIDDASQHIQNEDGLYEIVKGYSEDDICHISRTDAWYISEGENQLDVVANLANSIKMETQNGKMVLLLKGLTDTYKANLTKDFNENDSRSKINDINLEIVTNPYSTYYTASCQIPMSDENGQWIELHKVHFYIVNEKNLIQI